MEEKTLTLKQETEIKEKAMKLKEEHKLRKVIPMVVLGKSNVMKKKYMWLI